MGLISKVHNRNNFKNSGLSYQPLLTNDNFLAMCENIKLALRQI